MEVSLKALAGTFQVSDAYPLPFMSAGLPRPIYLDSWYGFHEPSEIERKLQKLSGKGLIKEGEEWKYKFEWDALQPQRARLVEPFIYLQVTSSCEAELSAKVYADSFANPIVLHGQINVSVQTKSIEVDVIVAKAKELAEASKLDISTYTSTAARINRLNALR